MGNTQLKSDLLGEPFGTAQNKLRKKLLFHLAGKANMLQCYRCAEQIETVAGFSVEHTKSWQYSANPVETFYDVEEIAFSHLICNVSASKDSSYSQKQITCSKGHVYSTVHKNGKLVNRCKECHAQHQRNYRSNG